MGFPCRPHGNPIFYESLSQQKLRSIYFEWLIKGLPECL